MKLNMASADGSATTARSFSVRNAGDSVVGVFGSLMSAFEVHRSQLRDGATIEREGRIIATYVATNNGSWRVWFFGGLS